MKTNHLTSCLRLLLVTSLGIFIQAPLHADEIGTNATAKLSAPGQPATLKIDVPWADIHLTGVEGDTVTVASTLNPKGKGTRADGLRRLDDEVSFELTEHNNVVSLTLLGDNPGSGHDTDFKISMPRAMALDIRAATGGNLEITDVTGDIEINNMNGEVRLAGIAGSTVVNTMNGAVHAFYAKAPQKLVAITSMNGEVELRIPGETKANVRLRSHNGSILTDFDEATLKTKSEGKGYTSDAAQMGADAARSAANAARAAAQVAQEFALQIKREVEQAVKNGTDTTTTSDDVSPAAPRAPRPPIPPLPPITGGKLVSGTLNGGGVDIKISTMNGEITLRRTEPAAPSASANTKPQEAVTVTFQDSDKFTDAGDRFSSFTSQDVLDELRDFIQKTASKLIAPGNSLSITVLDIDLAGDIRMEKDNIRVMTSVTPPRMHLQFKLIDADGKVVKEGERRLSDLNYQLNTRMLNRSDSLFYDKQLLQDWITKEFKTKR